MLVQPAECTWYDLQLPRAKFLVEPLPKNRDVSPTVVKTRDGHKLHCSLLQPVSDLSQAGPRPASRSVPAETDKARPDGPIVLRILSNPLD